MFLSMVGNHRNPLVGLWCRINCGVTHCSNLLERFWVKVLTKSASVQWDILYRQQDDVIYYISQPNNRHFGQISQLTMIYLTSDCIETVHTVRLYNVSHFDDSAMQICDPHIIVVLGKELNRIFF